MLGGFGNLVENRYVDCIVGFDPGALNIFSRDVLQMIHTHDSRWEELVPPSVAGAVKGMMLFGYSEPVRGERAEKKARVTQRR